MKVKGFVVVCCFLFMTVSGLFADVPASQPSEATEPSEMIPPGEIIPEVLPSSGECSEALFRLLEVRYEPICCVTDPCPQFVLLTNPGGPTTQSGRPYPVDLVGVDAWRLGFRPGESLAVAGTLENRYAGVMTIKPKNVYRLEKYARTDFVLRQTNLLEIVPGARLIKDERGKVTKVLLSVKIQRYSSCDVFAGISSEKLPHAAVLRGYERNLSEGSEMCIMSVPEPENVSLLLDLAADFGPEATSQSSEETRRYLILKDLRNDTTTRYLLVIKDNDVSLEKSKG